MLREVAHPAPPPPAERRRSGDIATEYGIHRRTLYAWQADGRIHVWKLGDRINIYDRREIEALIQPRRSA